MSIHSNSNEAIELYADVEKIYPREGKGRFNTCRVLAVWALLGLYYALPWISIDGQQLVLFDLPARKFYVFGLVFWPQDFILLSGLLALAALSLFLFTALAGRVWCGYACPQTVWTEVFIWMERFAEGKANKRKKRDKAGWNIDKVLRKTLKHTLWLLFALWTGFTFVGYFTPIAELSDKAVTFKVSGWESFWVLFYSFATWGNAGKLREQVCKYMCPYARFQSAMFDRDTLIVSYDQERGEPRGSRRRSLPHSTLAEQSLGDCIDCTLCVQVCPTGIDIRKGLQYECIGCAACIDVCDEVMERMDYPKGLVSYTTQNTMEGKSSRVIRPRIVMYTSVLFLLAVFWFWGVVNRPALILDVMRDRNSLYRETTEGDIENSYLLRVMNRTGVRQTFRFSVDGLNEAKIIGLQTLQLDSGGIGSMPITVSVPQESIKARNHIEFMIAVPGDPSLTVSTESRFLGPHR